MRLQVIDVVLVSSRSSRLVLKLKDWFTLRESEDESDFSLILSSLYANIKLNSQ